MRDPLSVVRHMTSRTAPQRSRVTRLLVAAAVSYGLLVATFHETTVKAAPAQPSPSPSPQRALLDKYCVTCHNERLKTGGLMLDKIDIEDVAAHADVFEKVVRKLRSGAMPPPGLPRPDTNAFATR